MKLIKYALLVAAGIVMIWRPPLFPPLPAVSALSPPVRSTSPTTLQDIHTVFLTPRSGDTLKKQASHSVSHLQNLNHRQLKQHQESVLSHIVRTLVDRLFNLAILPFGLLYVMYRWVRSSVADNLTYLENAHEKP
ncbi:hypothetical protein LJ739_01920 [Aestuariibacter halophilus]|uniref:Uncharacterized protein n=1 Tax=Fluctibacter halophilus TaxID=226011 RepID=A0ABS8G322_9ALTE|nr:hypothetical protein [Aestuariibacter halophilus]MCC2614997.1 hypothetical protein [Aestuariibacter halophilus]